MKQKVKTWIRRYGWAEVMGLTGAVSGGIFVNILFGNSLATAFGGTWGENIGYYGSIIIKDYKKHIEKYRGLSPKIIFKLFRNLILEFGPAECLDSFLIRPFTLYIFPKLLNNLPFGLVIGKFVADFIFYIPTILAYELKNKFIKDNF